MSGNTAPREPWRGGDRGGREEGRKGEMASEDRGGWSLFAGG